jgi:hypothetical protein
MRPIARSAGAVLAPRRRVVAVVERGAEMNA